MKISDKMKYSTSGLVKIQLEWNHLMLTPARKLNGFWLADVKIQYIDQFFSVLLNILGLRALNMRN